MSLYAIQIAPEKKQAALESKARGDEAFKKKDYMLAVDAYTQVSHNLLLPNRESL
jgi:hypothetical protein